MLETEYFLALSTMFLMKEHSCNAYKGQRGAFDFLSSVCVYIVMNKYSDGDALYVSSEDATHLRLAESPAPEQVVVSRI